MLKNFCQWSAGLGWDGMGHSIAIERFESRLSIMLSVSAGTCFLKSTFSCSSLEHFSLSCLIWSSRWTISSLTALVKWVLTKSMAMLIRLWMPESLEKMKNERWLIDGRSLEDDKTFLERLFTLSPLWKGYLWSRNWSLAPGLLWKNWSGQEYQCLSILKWILVDYCLGCCCCCYWQWWMSLCWSIFLNM